jgi:hypothetical protein
MMLHAVRRLPERLVWAYRLRRAAVAERPHRERFARFYRTLPRRDRVLYIFFTEGLLHFLAKTLEFLPPTANVVLIGAALPEDERAWVTAETKRPFHHIATYVDDRVVWEFLFEVNTESFGWIDVDCFVQRAALLDDLFAFAPHTALTCVWSYRTHGGHRMLCTHLVGVHRAVLAGVRQAGPPISPTVYSFRPTRRSAYRHSHARRLTRSHVRLIQPLLPAGENGLPRYPSDLPEKGHLAYFDTLTVYQLCAEGLGYRLQAVRDLHGTNTLDGHYSDEVIHVNAASYYRGFKHSANLTHRQYFRMLLPFDYLLMRAMAPRLPDSYRQRLLALEADLDDQSLPRTGLGRGIRRFFCERGVSPAVFDHPAWRFLDEEETR